MGAGYFNRQKDDAITEKQVTKIHKLKAAGIIKSDDKIIFKAHPINHADNREKIISALGEDSIYTLPNNIPFEILPVIGLAPTAVICNFSTILFTVEPRLFKHIIVDADTRDKALKNPIILRLIKSGVIRKRVVSGWFD